MHKALVLTIAVLIPFAAIATEPGQALTCTDADGDGYFAQGGCGTPVDCNDADPSTHPGAPEVCDGQDNDCDRISDNSPSCHRLCESPEPAIESPAFGDVDDNDYAHPRMAWTGNQYAFTCHDDLHGTVFQLLDVQGLPLGPTLQLGEGFQPSIAWTGEQYGVAFSQTFVRLSQSGNAIGEATALAPDSSVPSVVWNGSEFAVASVGCGGLCFSRIAADGRMLAIASLFFGPTSGPPSLVWNGSEYALVWWTPEGLLFARLDRAGVPIGDAIGIATRGYYFQVLWTGVDYAVIWSDCAEVCTDAADILFRRLAADGSPTGSATVVARGAEARFAWSGQEFALVWWGGWGGGGETLTFARLDANGNRVGTPVPFGEGLSPDVVWNGTNYRAAYFQYGTGHVYRTRQMFCNCASDAPESCNGVDDNCDGQVDEDAQGVDGDRDGVHGACDRCPNTPAGEMVNAVGCSISQLAPGSWPWKTHGEYVSAVSKIAREFAAQGLITEAQRGAIVSAAARSDVGKRD